MVYTALLRGINVGGNNKVDMKTLKKSFEQAGMKNVVTYINSGNIIFSTTSRSKNELAQILEKAIMDTFALQIKVLVLHLEDMKKVISVLPESWMNNDKLRCDVLFLWKAINDESILDKLIFKPEIETVKYAPGAIIWAIDKINVNKGSLTKLVGTELYRQMTIRNLNTTRKIYQLMLAAYEDDK
ncbi:DUF1697 domain-containing protein [Paenibacillus chitinolyticus]|uniref:DUF1697 domain-containing protein n=1 Tax=Paenibacillus chitinolyticus TaxID=79263 RepID=A0A410WQ58_9BACL|nr:DUF1697 domain-containing protein [Paenibacillus chitinolyticus]MCY9591041.1 DUF1697 domain-containing protein [Paenibacillus chitinolyticus]MCY9597158.1 DUF1697 domain-containing protein [Paenibacillus chitinolyticus]QAV16471.1 DUF1697 domain-containing protein [Paenibacillus chitinolyticus]